MIAQPTTDFLKNLKTNNHKSWFDEHKAEYLKAKEDFEQFIAGLIGQFSALDPAYGLLRSKDCVFRIYRDVRFSKNKTPYKTHWAAGISKGGKRVHIPGFYLHIDAEGESFFGGGIWHPETALLAKIRQEIDYNFEEFSAIQKNIKKTGLFEPMQDEETLTRPPKGYTEDNPAIEYLKMRNFILSAPLSPALVHQKKFSATLFKMAQTMQPFLNFIERAIDE